MTLPKRVLLVEDELITQRLLKDVCHSEGIEVVGCVDNASDALTIIRDEDEIDLILLDINIKGPMDGLRLAQKIRHMGEYCIVMATAYSDKDTLQETEVIAPDGFMVKPYGIDNIVVAFHGAYIKFIESEKNIKTFGLEDNKEKDIWITEDIRYSEKKMVVYFKGERVSFSVKELQLIQLLSKHLDETVSYATLFREIWQEDTDKGTSLRTLVYNMRRRLPELPLMSYSKIGYMLKKTS